MSNLPKTGKQYKGQVFVPITDPEVLLVEQAAQAPFDKPDAIPMEVYFSMRGIRNPVAQAAMRAFTNIRRATQADWDEIFKAYY